MDEQKSLAKIEEAKEMLSEIGKKKSEILNNFDVNSDFEFLKTTIKDTITQTQTTMNTLNETILVGASPGYFETYSYLVNSLSNIIKELRMLQNDVFNNKFKLMKELTKEEDKSESEDNGKIPLTPAQITDMVLSAKKHNKIDAIDADFEIEDENNV